MYTGTGAVLAVTFPYVKVLTKNGIEPNRR